MEGKCCRSARKQSRIDRQFRFFGHALFHLLAQLAHSHGRGSTLQFHGQMKRFQQAKISNIPYKNRTPWARRLHSAFQDLH